MSEIKLSRKANLRLKSLSDLKMKIYKRTDSIIHPEAKIGKGVTIGPFTYIDKNVEIGEGTWIGPNVTIFEGARIGKNCKIFPGAVISGIPQDLKFKGEETTAEIGDNTTIREYVTVNRGTAYLGKTVVGSNSLLMAYVHIAHDCIVGNNVILANNVGLAGHVEVEDWAILEGRVGVQQFIKIGMHVFIAGGSLVRKHVPPYVKAAREPLSGPLPRPERPFGARIHHRHASVQEGLGY